MKACCKGDNYVKEVTLDFDDGGKITVNLCPKHYGVFPFDKFIIKEEDIVR